MGDQSVQDKRGRRVMHNRIRDFLHVPPEIYPEFRQDTFQRNRLSLLDVYKRQEYDKIRGLDLGADYYLVKPFGVMRQRRNLQ